MQTESGFDRQYRYILFWCAAAVVAVLSWLVLQPLLPALLWAIVLSVLLQPVYRRFRDRWSENASALMAVFTALAAIIVPLGLVGALMFIQINELSHTLTSTAAPGENAFTIEHIAARVDEMARPLLERVGSNFSVASYVEKNREELIRSVRGPITSATIGFATGVFQVVIALLTMFFMLRDSHGLKAVALDVIPLPRERSEAILDRIVGTMRAVFVGIILVAVAQGTLAGLAYWGAGVPEPLIWTVATMILCAIPLLGSPIIYIPMSLLLMSQGKVWNGLFLLAFGLIVVSNLDNILRPFVIGARTGIHPIALFFSLLGGIFVMGPIGIMGGPVLLTFALAMIEIVRERRAALAAV
ncbi:MAG: putative transport protein [Fimbriimonadaceae bacterium]|nr:putative transport protein [Fimbriimonadaceae bacterium]